MVDWEEFIDGYIEWLKEHDFDWLNTLEVEDVKWK